MRVPSSLRIAWRNLGRNRRRTALALVAIATAQLVLVLYGGLIAGMMDWTLQTITGPLVGHVQIHAPKWREDRALDRYLPRADELLATVRRQPGVARATARIYAPALAAVGEEGHAVMLVGLDPAAEATSQGLLGNLPPGERPGDRRVLVGRGLAETLGIAPGAKLAVVGQAADGSVASELYTVAGVLASQVELVNRLGVVLSLDSARELLALPDAAHEIVIHASDPRQAEALAARLAALPALAGTEVLPWKQVVPELASIVELAGAATVVLLLLVFVAAAAGVANTMLMATFERIHELGMLLALGARPGRLVRMIVVESFVLGLLGVTIGTALGLAVVAATHRTGIDLSALAGRGGAPSQVAYGGLEMSMRLFPTVDVTGTLRGVVAVVVTSLLASLWPAARVARLEPMEAMRA